MYNVDFQIVSKKECVRKDTFFNLWSSHIDILVCTCGVTFPPERVMGLLLISRHAQLGKQI